MSVRSGASTQSALFGQPGRFGATPKQTPSGTPASSIPATPNEGRRTGNSDPTAGRPRPVGEYGLDSNIADIVAKRGRKPPSLEYLKFGEMTTHGQSFGYSEEMLEALGEKKSSKPPARPEDMANPWAVEPDELHEPIVSLYGKDFQGKQVKPTLDEKESKELAERNKILKAEIEKKRAENRAASFGSNIERRAPKSTTPQTSSDGTVKRFDHYGVYRRPQSVPLEQQIEAVQLPKKTDPSPQAIPDICNPLLGGESIFAWNPGSVAMAVEAQQKERRVSKDDLSKKKATPTAFWYPKDKQLKKHQRLENQRWDEGTTSLVANGWDTETVVGPREKKVTNPEFATTLSKEDQDRVDQQLEEYRNKVAAEKALKREKTTAMLKAQKEKEEAVKKQRETLRLKRVNPDGVVEGAEFSTTAGDYGASQARQRQPSAQSTSISSEAPYAYQDTELSLEQLRGQSKKPDQGFRAELPGARVPTGSEKERLLRLTMPPDPRTKAEAPAPPWGRPTVEDERYNTVKVYNSRNKKLKYETNGKLDVDRELRIVRDGGLQRKEKKSLLKSIDPEQLKYIKQMGNAAMRQTRNPPGGF